MLLCCSQRTDLCAFYSEWLVRRFQDGLVDIRNPFAPNQVLRVEFSPSQVDAVIFMTKNPTPMLDKMAVFRDYAVGFQVTVTPYGPEIEPGLTDKRQVLDSFRQLADQLGPSHMILRYDPIFLSQRYDEAFHLRAFERCCQQLAGSCTQVIISHLDLYKNTRKHQRELNWLPDSLERFAALACRLAEIGARYGMRLQLCAEDLDLSAAGIENRSCIDSEWLRTLTGKTLEYPLTQARPHCHCLQVTDLGEYNSCAHHCRYCYANFDEAQIARRRALHDPQSTLLIGHVQPDDQIVMKKKSERQLRLF